MEKFIYWRQTSGVAGDQDETSGSVMYPVSSIMSIMAGDAADPEGNITDDDNRFTIFLKPARVGLPEQLCDGGAGADRPDHVVVDTSGGDTDFRLVFEELLGYINAPSTFSNGMIILFDGVTGKGLSAITGVHASTMVVAD